MFPIYCYHCRERRNSLDGRHCLYCEKDNSVTPSFPGNFQPAVSESANVNIGVPALDTIPQMTAEDLSFLDEIGEDGNYQQVSNQNAAGNPNLLPENPNINKDNIYYTNIGRCNPAPFDPSLGSATYSHVVPEQRTYFHEQPPRNESQYIDEEGKLDFAGSIKFFSDYSMPNTCPDNSFNVNRLGARPETSNNSAVRYLHQNNKSSNFSEDKSQSGPYISNLYCPQSENPQSKISIFAASKRESILPLDDIRAVPGPSGFHQNKNSSDFYEEKFQSGPSLEMQSVALTGKKTFSFSFSENVETEEMVLEQKVQNAVSNVLKKRAKARLSCEECGKLCKNESSLNAHQQSNCDPNPYKCDPCDLRFPYESHLLKHQRLHTGKKLYECDQCAYETNLKGDLKKH